MNGSVRDVRRWMTAAAVIVSVLAVGIPAAAEEATEVEERSAPKVYREKTRITVEGRAEADGVLELVVEPRGEEPKKVRLNVLAKTKAKKITKELATQLDFALGDRYKVNRWGDDEIRIKTRGNKTPPVSIELETQQLAGVGIIIGKG